MPFGDVSAQPTGLVYRCTWIIFRGRRCAALYRNIPPAPDRAEDDLQQDSFVDGRDMDLRKWKVMERMKGV